MNILNIYNELDSHNFDLNVDHYGAEQCDNSYSFGPTIRDNYVLHFITEGKGEIVIEGKTTYLSAGDLFILPKDTSIFYKADEFDPWTYIWVGFSGSRAKDLLNQSQLLEQYYLHSSLDSQILHYMSQINQIQNHSIPSINELMLIGYLNQLLATLIKEFPNQNLMSPETQTKHYVQQAIKMIHSHYAQPIKVSEIATHLALSRSYLYKIFKQETGYSIKDYILQIKMQRSCQLLEDLNLTITEISYSVGYQDPLTFSAAFRHYFHTSPSSYRKKYINKED
ncbi:AraC family transcriptional regulator [Streptococcus suis]|nr:AraC family transcriptional regulator [Streptococcus suis]